eukprot:CAMPEP_0117013998 /NCGR_PEP_ID=MMETSP0472-20121206/11447_1 /TAXON_ID=693140 ORGANISM="Tiarina fusus, Strain LIS" /NCGR_SAMPLE_ID=MMETSP0472 /ASSEMBLY_ACC=CAM_ASM_000603 /LENGTH=235 /DNA_ID=CAMNT_0004717465 /DNA_START=31 /DNA_END=738 /DNA_ORIENTATION=+
MSPPVPSHERNLSWIDLSPRGMPRKEGEVDGRYWNYNRAIVPVKLHRLGVTEKLWENAFDQVDALDRECAKDMENRLKESTDTAKGKCCYACCGGPSEVERIQIAKKSAAAMHERWIDLIKALQPLFTSYGVDMAPLTNLFMDQIIGVRFYLPDGSRKDTTPLEVMGGLPAVQAEIMSDRGGYPVEATDHSDGGNKTSTMIKDLEKIIAFHQAGELEDDEFALLKSTLIKGSNLS